MAVQVKICGLNDPASFDAAVEAAADWVGFVFYPPSPRAITPAQAACLSARQPGGPRRVGLFVNPDPAEIARTLDHLQLDILQVYATAAQAIDLQTRFGLPVWHAVGVATSPDLPKASATQGLVIEAKPPKGATRPGGNAASFDWTILQNWTAPAPWLLAGGLTPHNVAQAIKATTAPAVDTSSGVETSPGHKDPALIARFVAAVRGTG